MTHEHKPNETATTVLRTVLNPSALDPTDPLPHVSEALRERIARTQSLIAELKGLWTAEYNLTAEERKHSVGRGAARYLDVNVALRDCLAANGSGTPEARADVQAQLDATVGRLDGGEDPRRFEPDALLEQVANAAAAFALSDALEQVHQRLSDFALSAGELGVERTLVAVGQLKQIARANADLRPVAVPVLEALSAMTEKARAARLQRDAAPTPATPSPGV